MRGIFAVYKPKGPTSYQIVEKIKKLTGEKKVGHAGTLDPLAEGVLVVGVGREATKKLGEIVSKEKEYEAVIFLGKESETDDEEGQKREINLKRKTKPSLKEIEKVKGLFVGEVLQIPPKFSAVKVAGRKAYKRARKGEDFKLKPRKVFIKEIEILDFSWPFLKIKVVTGAGVYIRSLARDIGRKLKTGAYLKELKRLRVGSFEAKEALNLEELEKIVSKSKKRNKNIQTSKTCSRKFFQKKK